MKNKIHFIIILLCMVSLSCTKEKGINIDNINSQLTNEKSQEIIEANNEFAFDIFKKVYENVGEENFMISPLSLSLALNMIYNGADGETKKAFEDVFKYNMSTLEINEFNKNLITKLSSNVDGSVMEIANSIWVNQNYTLKDDFVQTNQNYYSAKIQNLDFGNLSSRDIINNWVSEKTSHKITEILDNISEQYITYLINALYFNANWKYDFDPEETHTGDFNTETGNKSVDFMRLDSDLLYTENEYFSSIELPYENDKFSMVIILPNTGVSTTDICNELNAENWNNWQNSYHTIDVTLKLPKFRYDYENQLNNELSDLGLGIAFTDNANFSKMCNSSSKISFVIQKTFIDVNEEGTEAAAVTVVGMIATSGGNSVYFNVNKPFIYLIKENLTGSICFIGKVGSPEYD